MLDQQDIDQEQFSVQKKEGVRPQQLTWISDTLLEIVF